MKSYLYNSQVRNSYTGNTIYRLALKLTPTQWNKVKEYFLYYNFDELQGWGTTHPHNVIRALLEDENEEFQKLLQKIEQTKKDITNANGYLEAEEFQGLLFNLKREARNIVSSYIPY